MVAYGFRFNTLPDARYDALLAAIVPFTWVAILGIRGSYDDRWITTGAEPFRRVLESGLILLSVAAVASFFTRAELSRGFVVLGAALITGLTLVSRYAARKQLHSLLARGRTIHEVVVAGSFAEVNHVVAHMQRSPYAGFKVVSAWASPCTTAPSTASMPRWRPPARTPWRSRAPAPLAVAPSAACPGALNASRCS